MTLDKRLSQGPDTLPDHMCHVRASKSINYKVLAKTKMVGPIDRQIDMSIPISLPNFICEGHTHDCLKLKLQEISQSYIWTV